MYKRQEKYDLVDSKEDFIALLNILQACDENLESLHESVREGTFCDIDGRWDSDREFAKVLLEHDSFYTEEEFIEYIMYRWNEWEEDRDPDLDAPGSEHIRQMTDDEEEMHWDTQITKTDDGYVVRRWY